MFKKILIISVLLILSIGVVSASENVTDDISAADDAVISSADDLEKIEISDDDSLQSTIKVSGNTFDDVEKAVDKAKANDVIQLSGTYTGSSSIYVDKSLTIQGDSNKAVLDAKGKSSIILTSFDAKITLKNLVFKNSLGPAADLNGGATVENCNFEGCEYGINCAESSESSILIVKNCNFNKIKVYSIYAQVKSMTVEKSAFTNCKESAINIYSSKSTSVSVKDSSFTGNAASFGVALNAMVSKGTLNVENCKFTNNVASSVGTVYVSGDGTFQCNILKSTFTSNSAKDGDSALFLYDVESNVKNNVFVKNTGADEMIKSVGYIDHRGVLENNIIKNDAKVNENLNIQFVSVPAYYGDVFEVKFTKDNAPLSNKNVELFAFKKGSVLYEKFSAKSDANGIVRFAFSSDYTDYPGVWDIQAVADSGSSKILSSKNSINVKHLDAKIVSADLTTTYASGKSFSFKTVNKNTNNVASGVRLYVTIYKDGYFLKNMELLSNINGVSNVKISNLAPAKYVVHVDSFDTKENVKMSEVSFKVKINKAPTKVSAPKVTNKFKKSKYFKVTVKAYNKPVKKLKLKLKVYVGKKSKSYTVTTNAKGIAQFNTKVLSKGSHKVEISSANSNYKVSAKSTVVIK